MTLNEWQLKYGVTWHAMDELRNIMTATPTDPISQGGCPGLESVIQTDIRLEASIKGMRIWRNNVGAALTNTGSFVRYGLCNDSPKMNKLIKSSDLIGIRPVYITMDHVGQTIGQFVAREVKHGGWSYTGNDHEAAQLRFIELITGYGGDAKFATGDGTL